MWIERQFQSTKCVKSFLQGQLVLRVVLEEQGQLVFQVEMADKDLKVARVALELLVVKVPKVSLVQLVPKVLLELLDLEDAQVCNNSYFFKFCNSL